VEDEIASHPGTKILKVFDSDVFQGVSVESTSDSAEYIKTITDVSHVWNSKKIKLAPIIGLQSFSGDASASLYNIHNMTGVDKLHKQGIYGKGALVAIVDTGTYYTHPAVSKIHSKQSLY